MAWNPGLTRRKETERLSLCCDFRATCLLFPFLSFFVPLFVSFVCLFLPFLSFFFFLLVVHTFFPALRRQRGRRISVNLRPAWSTQRVSGQPELHRPYLKIKKKNAHEYVSASVCAHVCVVLTEARRGR